MKRVLWSVVLAGAGLMVAVLGWIVPAHVRAVDEKVLARSMRSVSLVNEGLLLVRLERAGPAELLLEAAERENLPEREKLKTAIADFWRANSKLQTWGGADPYVETVFRGQPIETGGTSRSIVEVLTGRTVRQALGGYLSNSRRVGVQQVLANAQLTNTVLFPPAATASGQALEIAVVLTALLYQGDHLSDGLRDQIERGAAQANDAGEGRELELIYLDLISLGRRLNWVQLSGLMRQVENAAELRRLAHVTRAAKGRLAILYTAVHLSGSPSAVCRYLMRYSETGWDDLSYSLRWGQGGVRELLETQQRIARNPLRSDVVRAFRIDGVFSSFTNLARNTPPLALALKYALLGLGGFLLARSLWTVRFGGSEGAESVERFSLMRHSLFALGFVVAMAVVDEPFLTQESQAMQFPLRFQFPVVQGSVVNQIKMTLNPMMDQLSVLALILFLVLQGGIYIACLIKLAEIRRQAVSNEVKIRLLENEENLFDAGLYCGLAGTVLSLVFLAMGVIKPSLIAAYSSTLFGIIFVAILKICHVRPFRRRLILENQPPVA